MKNYLLMILAVIAGFIIAPVVGAATLAGGLSFASVEDLERYANRNLSSFNGEEEENFEGDEWLNSFEDEDYYDGSDEDGIDFGGPGKNFLTAGIAKDTPYVMTLVNANAEVRYCYITPGYIDDQGTVLDGSFADINGDAGLTGSGSPKGVKYFHAFLEEVPTICNGFKISSTVATQVSQIMTIEQLSPFRNLADKPIDLGSFTDEHSFQDKIVTVPTPGLVLGAQTRIKLPVVGSSTCTVTFWIGAMRNVSKELEVKAGKAITSATQPRKIAPVRRIPQRPNQRMIRGR